MCTGELISEVNNYDSQTLKEQLILDMRPVREMLCALQTNCLGLWQAERITSRNDAATQKRLCPVTPEVTQKRLCPVTPEVLASYSRSQVLYIEGHNYLKQQIYFSYFSSNTLKIIESLSRKTRKRDRREGTRERDRN
jgi:hypothetical protein